MNIFFLTKTDGVSPPPPKNILQFGEFQKGSRKEIFYSGPQGIDRGPLYIDIEGRGVFKEYADCPSL